MAEFKKKKKDDECHCTTPDICKNVGCLKAKKKNSKPGTGNHPKNK